MESKSVSYYIKLYEKKNIRQAATELYISPQGLSKVLQNLERELDTLLFERTQTGLVPTLAGESFYRDAKKLEKDVYSLGLIVTDVTDGENGLEKKLLFQKKPVVLVHEGHHLYEKKEISYKDLNGEPLIMEGNDFWIHKEFRKKCLEKDVYPNIIIETGDISFCHKL